MAVTFPTASDSTTRSAGHRSSGRLRLTRRGRFVVVLTALAVILLAGFTVGRVSASNAAGVGEPRTTVVEPGDTLWSIAAATSPDRDPRTVVTTIERLNHLSSAELVPGMQLRLPS